MLAVSTACSRSIAGDQPELHADAHERLGDERRSAAKSGTVAALRG